jgi:hypothetical protein
VNVETLGLLNLNDDYETELKVMSEVRGYFQIAYKANIEILVLPLHASEM